MPSSTSNARGGYADEDDDVLLDLVERGFGMGGLRSSHDALSDLALLDDLDLDVGAPFVPSSGQVCGWNTCGAGSPL